MGIDKEYFTPPEFAKIKGVSYYYVKKALRSGSVRYVERGKRKMIPKSEVFRKQDRGSNTLDIRPSHLKTLLNREKAFLYHKKGDKAFYINFDREFIVVNNNIRVLKTTNEDLAVKVYNDI